MFLVYANSKDSDQPAHARSLILAVAVLTHHRPLVCLQKMKGLGTLLGFTDRFRSSIFIDLICDTVQIVY